MRVKEKKYILADGREITIKSAGPEDFLYNYWNIARIFSYYEGRDYKI